ncbi:hypothetical protein AHAS_Ahas03G0216500 [Arachis hypogaea]
MAADLCPLSDAYRALLRDSGGHARPDQVHYGGAPAVSSPPDQVVYVASAYPWHTPISCFAATSGPSSSTAAAGPSAPSASASQPPPPPSSAPQLTYRLVQHLIVRMDRSDRSIERHFRHVNQMLASMGAAIPPEEVDHEEEAGQAEAPSEIQAST